MKGKYTDCYAVWKEDWRDKEKTFINVALANNAGSAMELYINECGPWDDLYARRLTKKEYDKWHNEHIIPKLELEA